MNPGGVGVPFIGCVIQRVAEKATFERFAPSMACVRCDDDEVRERAPESWGPE